MKVSAPHTFNSQRLCENSMIRVSVWVIQQSGPTAKLQGLQGLQG